MENFTPGPWTWWTEAEGRPKKYDLIRILGPNKEMVLCAYGNGELTPNYRLMVMAPELLAACESALEDGANHPLSENIKVKLLSVIAKAHGLSAHEYQLERRVKELEAALVAHKAE